MAYKAVFYGRPTPEDQELVLVDLAETSGFYKFLPPPHDGGFMSYTEGKRALYGRIFGFLSLSDTEQQSLATAARATASERAALENSYRED